jgi:hypothetical protein
LVDRTPVVASPLPFKSNSLGKPTYADIVRRPLNRQTTGTNQRRKPPSPHLYPQLLKPPDSSSSEASAQKPPPHASKPNPSHSKLLTLRIRRTQSQPSASVTRAVDRIGEEPFSATFSAEHTSSSLPAPCNDSAISNTNTSTNLIVTPTSAAPTSTAHISVAPPLLPLLLLPPKPLPATTQL